MLRVQDAAEKAARVRLAEVERLRRLHAGLDGRQAAQVWHGYILRMLTLQNYPSNRIGAPKYALSQSVVFCRRESFSGCGIL